MNYVRFFSILFCIIVSFCSANDIVCMYDKKKEMRERLRAQAAGYPKTTTNTPVCDEWKIVCCLYASCVHVCCSKEVVAEMKECCGCSCCSSHGVHEKK